MGSVRIAALWRYPVKSMAGEPVDDVEIAESGLAMDRRLALRDRETGLIVSAKNPRLWGDLLGCSAAVDPGDGHVRIVLPDGEMVRSDDPAAGDVLSSALGRPVELCSTATEDAAIERLWPDVADLAPPTVSPDSPGAVTVGGLAAAAPPGTFFDFAPVHVVTAATLAALGRLTGGPTADAVEARRFRPNLVLDGELAPFAENSWPGARIRLGDDVVLHVLAPSPRCIVPSLPQPGIGRDTDLLRAIARHNRVDVLDLGRYGCVGAYAMVEQPGPVALGDAVRVRGAT